MNWNRFDGGGVDRSIQFESALFDARGTEPGSLMGRPPWPEAFTF